MPKTPDVESPHHTHTRLSEIPIHPHRLFTLLEKKINKNLPKLLTHVVRGEQKEAESILKCLPELLTVRDRVVDPSGRDFYQVSPWEYMLWAMDTRYMGQMMLNCIPEGSEGDGIRQACIAQYQAIHANGGGIDYEQPATCKTLVKLDNIETLEDIPFIKITKLFDAPDALIFCNNQFYYANKKDSSITLIPTHDLPPEQLINLNTLKTMFSGMTNQQSRLPSTLEEYRLINILFNKNPAFRPTYHHEAHYNFAIINALQEYVDCLSSSNQAQQNRLWIHSVSQAQRLAPAHVLQHYCDPDRGFHPTPDFQASEFKRQSNFYDWDSGMQSNLLTDASVHANFGFQFGLIRGNIGQFQHNSWTAFATGTSLKRDLALYNYDVTALRKLYEVRAADSRTLLARLYQSLKSTAIAPTEQPPSRNNICCPC